MARHRQHFKASDNLFHHTVTGALQCMHVLNASNWPWQGNKRGSKGPARTSQGGEEFKLTIHHPRGKGHAGWVSKSAQVRLLLT